MKRTSLLCVLAVVLMVVMAFPAWAAVEIFRVGVETPVAPAYINYTLNCECNVTVDIIPSDSNGVPSGGAILAASAPGAKGQNLYLWPCIDSAGVAAATGYYIAQITATNAPTGKLVTGEPSGLYRWDANIGLFKNWQRPTPVSEWPYYAYPIDSAGLQTEVISLPSNTNGATDETINGFYGVGVNHNTASLFYGRIYATHVTNQEVYMYDVDGSFIGPMNDSDVTWMTSAPWDISVADDDYVYVSDRTNMYVYCFAPDGSGMLSRSPATTNDRGIFASYNPSDTLTYVYVSSGGNIYQYTLAADHVTWSTVVRWRCAPLDIGADGIYGMWVSPDQLTMYVTNRGGGSPSWAGLRKYTRLSTTTRFAHVTTWVSGVDGWIISDVEMGHDGTYLWAADNGVATTAGLSMVKLSVATGAILDSHNITAYPFHVARDGVGNVLCGFGKSSTTWGSKYLGMFAEGVATTKVVTTGVFYKPDDPAPVIVPGSEEWVYSNGYGELIPDGSDTATVTFRVLDANGFSDIGDIDMDLKELKTTADTSIVQQPDTKVQDGALYAICTKTVRAVNGVPYGNREIALTVRDTDTSETTAVSLHVWAAGNIVNTWVKHTRSGANIPDATLRLIGGIPGVYGYPFTVESSYVSDYLGYVEGFIGQGDYAVTAVRTGFNTVTGVTVAVPAVSAPYGATTTIAANVYLGPLSITQAKAFENLQLYCSIEGLVYAQPKGRDGTAALGYTFVPGLDKRLDVSVSNTENYYKHSWYMLDPAAPTNGMQFQLKMTLAQGQASSTFVKQWDDTSLKFMGGDMNSYYLGKRPANGDTVCVSGILETRPTYETKMNVDDAFLANAASGKYKQAYYNLTQYGIVLTQPLPTPAVMTNTDIYHVGGGLPWHSSWGTYAELKDVKVVKNRMDGGWAPTPLGYLPADPNPFVIVVDTAGVWGTVTFQSLTSYGMTAGVCPVNMGDTYTFKGAVGRRARQCEGTIRPRGAADMTHVSDVVDPGADSVDAVRGLSSGAVSVRGIVTAVFGTTSFYVENSDRSVGVKVMPCPTWVSEGDDVIVNGNLIVVGIDKHIAVLAGNPVVVLSSGNPLPELGMRTRDVGGHDYGPGDVGITYGRGPLNVGLYVTIQGTVTYRDTTGVYPAFYVWDGTNMVKPGEDTKPLNDDNPGGHIGLRVAHNGWLGAPYSRGLLQYKDFVTIKGIVGLDDTTVLGQVIPVIIPISITPETVFDTMASAAGGVLNWAEATGDTNYISLPGVPARVGTGEFPDPMGGVNPYPWDPTVVLAGPGQNIMDTSQAIINRLENANGTGYMYDMWAPDAFGGMNTGDGYWVNLIGQIPWELSISGKYSTIPQWYAVEYAGDVFMGHPHNYNTELEDIKVSNGGAVYSFRDASQHTDGLALNWLQSIGFWYNNADGTTYGSGLWDDWTDTTSLQPWHAFTFTMNEGQKAWIIP